MKSSSAPIATIESTSHYGAAKKHAALTCLQLLLPVQATLQTSSTPVSLFICVLLLFSSALAFHVCMRKFNRGPRTEPFCQNTHYYRRKCNFFRDYSCPDWNIFLSPQHNWRSSTEKEIWYGNNYTVSTLSIRKLILNQCLKSGNKLDCERAQSLNCEKNTFNLLKITAQYVNYQHI